MEVFRVNLEVDGQSAVGFLTPTEIEEISNDQIKYLQQFEKFKLQKEMYESGNNSCEIKHNENSLPKTKNVDKADSFRWTPESVKLLLDLRLGKENEFNNPICKKQKLYNEIAKKMKIEGGYTVDGNDCNAKYRNLLQTYRHNKDKRLKTTGESKITWEYYCIFDNVLGTKDSSRPREELLSTSLQISDENKCQEDDSQPGTSGLQKKQKTIIPKLKNENKKMSVSEYLFYKKKREEEKMEQRKVLKEKEIDALNNLANAVRHFSKKRRHNSSSDSD